METMIDNTLLEDSSSFFFFERSTRPHPFLSGTQTLPWDNDIERFLREAEEFNATLTTANTWPRRWHRNHYKIRNGKAVYVGRQHHWENVSGRFERPEVFEELPVTLETVSGRSVKTPHIGGMPIEF